MSTVMHCCFDLGYVLLHAREMARHGVTLNGEKATEASLTAHATILRARGYEVMPTCAKHDARGYCTGTRAEREREMNDQQNQGTGRPLPISEPFYEPADNSRFWADWSAFNDNCGHAPTMLDMWLIGRGEMDTTGRAAQPISEQGSARVREAAAEVCERLAGYMENGAGELEPGARLRQAAQMIRALASSERAPEPSDPSPAQDASQLD